jgi:nitronate monooxygenase
MWTDTAVTRRLGIALPILQAPLGGGPGTPALAAAVGEAGGLGFMGVGYLSPDAIREAVRQVRALTDKPFGANLFLPGPAPSAEPGLVEAARQALAPFHAAAGLTAPPPAAIPEPPDVDAQLDVLLAERAPVIGFTFGVPDARLVDRVRRDGAVLVGTATTPAEGQALSDAGVDLVVAQGAEAGGHRGSFSPDTPAIGLVALVPALADLVDVPVIAAGGIMDGRGIAAALALGADAAALGTAFLATPEAGTNPAYRAALAAADGTATVVTDRITGRPARGIRNRYVDTFPAIPLPPYPVMHALTRDLRAHNARTGRADHQSLWAGQGVGLLRDRPAGQLVRDLADEVDRALDGLARRPAR